MDDEQLQREYARVQKGVGGLQPTNEIRTIILWAVARPASLNYLIEMINNSPSICNIETRDDLLK